MKKIIFALALFTTLVFLSACMQTKDNTLKIWAWNKNVDILEDAVLRYQEDHPDFKADVIDFGKADINTKISTAASLKDSSDMADIFLGDWIYMRSNYELFPELFADLSGDITNAELEAFPYFATEVVKNENDQLYALPFGIGPTVTFVYMPLMNQAGVTNEEIANFQENGWTWDDYYTIGQELQKIDNDYYMSAYNLSNDDRLFRTMNSQKGFWFMDRTSNVTISNSESQASLGKVKTFFNDNIVKHVDSGDYKSLMVEGKIAAQIQGFWLSGQIKDLASDQSGDWRILPCPSWNSEESGASITGGSYLYVNNQSEMKQEAIDFIKWQTMEVDNVIRALEVGGIFPVLSASYNDDRFVSVDNFFGSHNYLLDVANNVSEAKPIFPSKNNGFNYDTFLAAQYNVLFNDKDILLELQAAETLMNSNKSD